MLSIAGRAGHAFIAPAMMEGFACHARGVELVACGAARVHARVRSKRVHDVLLRAEKGRLSIGCTCPARTYGLDFCKHAWAALLEVDRQDGLADLRRTRGPLGVDAAPAAPSSDEKVSEIEAPAPESQPRRKKKQKKVEAPSTPEPAPEPTPSPVPVSTKEAKARAPKAVVNAGANTKPAKAPLRNARTSSRDKAAETSSKKTARKSKRR